MTFFSVFDVPVFWPILLLYWFMLFFVTMKRQIRHMIKYRYIPFTLGKKVSTVGRQQLAALAMECLHGKWGACACTLQRPNATLCMK
jgi:hypothetical protein